MEKLGFTVPEAAALSSLARRLSTRRSGRRLRIRKYGTRTIITRTDLASFLENLPDEPSGPRGDRRWTHEWAEPHAALIGATLFLVVASQS